MSVAGGHRGFTVRINTNQINKYIQRLEKRVDRVSIEALNEIAEAGAEYAEDLYATAQYDGEHDAELYISQEGARTVELTAIGDSVNFIEYGTGVWGSGKQRWYFSAKGRDIQLTATGEPATYTRGGKTKVKYYFEGKRGGKYYVSKSGYVKHLKDYGTVSDDGKSITVAQYSAKDFQDHPVTYDLQKEVTKTPFEVVERSDAFVTSGNPPQYIMQRTRDYMMSRAPEIISKYIKENA